jgi:predicted Na+-dependent transporter
MEKRAIGVILTLLGVIALIIGAYFFVNHGESTHNMKMIVTFLVLGLIFFVSGIGLVRNTSDVLKNDEHVS